MITDTCEEAINNALIHGRALLKYISPNDVGATGSHQVGYYLPKSVWKMYTPHGPTRGENSEHFVEIRWFDGKITESCVKWYGVGTRSEYRLTRFGRGFDWLKEENIGNLLVLIPTGSSSFRAYVLVTEEDVESLVATLGIELVGSWAAYGIEIEETRESEAQCIERQFIRFSQSLNKFPATAEISMEARETLIRCVKDFVRSSPDDKILALMDTEYRLFQKIEKRVCEPEIKHQFKSLEEFLKTASSITNRRKARAGRSLENHVHFLLEQAGIKHDMGPDVDGKPDILIPGKQAYLDESWPDSKLMMVGVKTTCKDRWRQVLNEARRIRVKHLLTLQQGISRKQLDEMHSASVTLIVPKPLHKLYPRGSKLSMVTLEEFVTKARALTRGC